MGKKLRPKNLASIENRSFFFTGLTVCVLFYNTSDVMQIAKCNVEWFYDGCKEHKISLDPVNASQVSCLHSPTTFVKILLP